MKQKGAIELQAIIITVVAAVVISAFLGLWSYYSSQSAMLKKTNADQATTIQTMQKARAEDMGKIALYTAQQSNWDEQVKKQNAALNVCTVERAKADKLVSDLQLSAAQQKRKSESTIADILSRQSAPAATPAQICEDVSSELRDYVKGRQTK